MHDVATAALGALSWTGVEYCLHRFVGHGPRREPPATLVGRLTPSGFLGAFNDEHLRHHADARYFAPTSQKLAAAVVTMALVSGVGSVVAGPRAALAYAAGLVAMYGAYELVHRRIHTHPPRGPYGRWVRRNHLAHHFKQPRARHGVTSPLWDVVAGTRDPLPDGALRVPRRLAPDWMVDAQGRVHGAYAADYACVTVDETPAA